MTKQPKHPLRDDHRATCLTCMDGRIQIPVINWIRRSSKVKYVDIISGPGMDGILTRPHAQMESILTGIKISTQTNHSSHIFVVGHFDCRGNPVPYETHKEQIIAGAQKIKKLFSSYPITGLWVNSKWHVKKIIDLF